MEGEGEGWCGCNCSAGAWAFEMVVPCYLRAYLLLLFCLLTAEQRQAAGEKMGKGRDTREEIYQRLCGCARVD